MNKEDTSKKIVITKINFILYTGFIVISSTILTSFLTYFFPVQSLEEAVNILALLYINFFVFYWIHKYEKKNKGFYYE